MRRRLPPLVPADLQVAVDVDALPRHEHVVEHAEAIGLVEAAGQRIVERVHAGGGVGAPRIELQPGRVDRDDDAVGIGLVARAHRMDAGEMQAVGEHAGGRELLGAGDDDAVVALLDDAGIERRVLLRMRGLAAVDLRRDDRVGDIEMVVAQALVDFLQVVGEVGTARREQRGLRGVAGDEARDVIGRATHQAEGRLRPGLGGAALRPQIVVALRDLPGPPHRRAGLGRRIGHQLAVLGRRGKVEQAGDAARRLAECRVRGDVLDAFAVDINRAPVAQRAQVFRPGAHSRGCSGRHGTPHVFSYRI